MGYGEAVRDILTELHKRRSASEIQTILISATLGENVKSLADLSLKSPKYVEAGQKQGGFTTGKSEESSTFTDRQLIVIVMRIPLPKYHDSFRKSGTRRRRRTHD